jgi:hypothetical protein
MRHLMVGTVLLLSCVSLLLSSCGPAPSVVQGTVVRYDAAAKLVVLRDEIAPHASLELSVDGAEVGAEPAPGDAVRIAYRVVGDRFVATRVMNVTRQDELGKKGGTSSGGH